MQRAHDRTRTVPLYSLAIGSVSLATQPGLSETIHDIRLTLARGSQGIEAVTLKRHIARGLALDGRNPT